MNKNTTWIVLAVILIALLAWYFTQNGGTKTQTTDNSTTNSTSQAASTSGTTSKSSLKSLMAAGSSVSCTFDSSEGKGTAYVTGDKMRVDYTAMGTSGHMINDGQFLYMWTDGSKTGIKMSSKVDNNSIPGSSQAPDLNTQQDYTCKPWTQTSSSFAVPSTVTFTTLGV